MNGNRFYNFLILLAICGNLLFILWITYNGIDEGFSGTLPQKVSYVSLIVLLILNIILLWRNRQK
jgi:hypothetical protein